MTHIATHKTFPRQHGVATLIIVLILLFSITGITLYAAQSGIMEQKVSANDYRAKQLQEAADAGLEYAVGWLKSYQPSWGSAVSGYEYDTGSISTTVGNYAIAVELKRPTADRKKVTITATASETGNSNLTASTQTTIVQKMAVGASPQAPIVINGCISGVTGSPDIDNSYTTSEVQSSQNGACVEQGHFNSANGWDVDGNAFTGTAWDQTFGMSMADMKALADLHPNIHWVESSSPYHDSHGSLGPPIDAHIVIFTGCPKINGGPTIVGVVYYLGPCTTNGYGGAQIYGSVVIDGDATGFNANTDFVYRPDVLDALGTMLAGVGSRVPGAWIDQ